MADRERPYLFYDVALSICSTCLRKIEAKIVFQDGAVYMLKRCPEHGSERVLIADDIEYYRRCREVFLKPPEMPNRFNTPIHWGCPYDCGLCPDHEQHSCLTLVEVTDFCNLRCPVCYASSGPERKQHRDLSVIEGMLDAIVANERRPDVVQISGGEPTLHPDFFRILDAARQRPIQHLMVNTNGTRIASDPEFAARLARYMPGFEIYLQFDSLEEQPLRQLRGLDLRNVRRAAIARLNELEISTTLVVTVKRGLNDGELGRIIEYAVSQPCVRGVVFQPVQSAAPRRFQPGFRSNHIDRSSPPHPRTDLAVPRGRYYPGSMSSGFAGDGLWRKDRRKVMPLSGLIDPQVLIDGGRNTIVFEADESLQKAVFKTFSTNHSPQSASATLRELLCCLPKVDAPSKISYENVFRVIVMQFLDASFVRCPLSKEDLCPIAHPDGKRLIPFDTYNLFYRDGLEETILTPLREMARRA